MAVSIENLSLKLEQKNILNSVSLDARDGEMTLLLGKNGAGKSSIAQTIIGNPKYEVISGSIIIDNDNILDLSAELRSKKVFVSFQNPPEVEGVSLMSFLHSIYVEKYGPEDVLSRSTFKFRKHIMSLMDKVGLKKEFLDRDLNVGFSGGEKKRSELLQLILLKPKNIILDEIDSGLDIHALDTVKSIIDEFLTQGSSILFISHNVSFVQKFENSKVYLIDDGKIVKSGNSEIIEEFKSL